MTKGKGRRGASRAAALAVAALSLATAGALATGPSAEAIQCPPGTVSLGILCVRGGTPVTSPPQTTTTTAPPLVNVPPVTLPPVGSPPPASGSVAVPDAARRLLDLANAERTKAGLGQLSWRDDVASIAQAHSERMAQAGDIFHSDSFFGSAVKNLLNVVARGENVAYNGDIDGAHGRLMGSAGHRANILDAKFSAAGIGVVWAADGRYFITENFIQPAGAPRSAAAPRPATGPRAAAPRPAPAPARAATTTTSAAAAPVTTQPEPEPSSVVADAATLSLAKAAPTVIAATGLPEAGHQRSGALTASALVLLGIVSVSCWLLPRRRS